jgi:hypothetical protein
MVKKCLPNLKTNYSSTPFHHQPLLNKPLDDHHYLPCTLPLKGGDNGKGSRARGKELQQDNYNPKNKKVHFSKKKVRGAWICLIFYHKLHTPRSYAGAKNQKYRTPRTLKKWTCKI